MSEPMWLGGDPASYADPLVDTLWEFSCGNDACEYQGEVPAEREDGFRVTRIYAEWVCPECGYENTSETEWDE